MKKIKKARLEAAGWAVGSTKEFLRLSEGEAAFIELKLALAERLRRRRLERGLSQTRLAKLLASSQSRVAKMETGDRSVSLDLLVRSLLAIGVTRREIARLIDTPNRRSAA
jgi:ribosome-binding protein aMBF1 (putative translation factor)